MKKRLLFLTAYVLSISTIWAIEYEDIDVNVNAYVGVPVALYPTNVTGETSWDFLYATDGGIYGKNAYILSDESAFEVITNKHLWGIERYSSFYAYYYDYLLTPLKVGDYTFIHKVSYVHDPYNESGSTSIYNITYHITVVPLINYLYSSNFTGGAGAQVSMPIFMENDVNVAGFQFDLELPDGVSVSTKDGDLDVSVTDRTSTHTLTGKTLSSGDTRFTVFSLSNTLIKGTSGTVMNVKLNIDKDMPLGDYLIQIKNVQLTEKNGADLTSIYAIDRPLTLTVRSVAKGDVNADGIVNVTDAIGIISYILEETPTWFTESVADVNGDGLINVTDVIAVIDIILSENN